MQCDVYVLHVVWVLVLVLVLLMASSLASKQFAWGLSVCSLGNFIGVVRACLIR
jgi:hypothetical protein